MSHVDVAARHTVAVLVLMTDVVVVGVDVTVQHESRALHAHPGLSVQSLWQHASIPVHTPLGQSHCSEPWRSPSPHTAVPELQYGVDSAGLVLVSAHAG